MSLYKVTKKEIETTERTYEVEGFSEDDALESFAVNNWSKVISQCGKTTKHTELVIENIL
jgi:hypothetical protein